MGSISTDSTPTISNFATINAKRSNSLTSAAPSTVMTKSLTHSSSVDSGFNSPSSSPQHGMFTKENGELKTQADLRKTGSLDKLVEPSSAVTDEADVKHPASQRNIQ